MNKTLLIGRLVRDAEITYSQGEKQTCIAKFTLAVDRRFKKEGEPNADFIRCTAFGKSAEFIEKWVSKGTKVGVVGHWQTDSFTNKDGVRIFTNTCMIEEVEFAESKATQHQTQSENTQDGFEEASEELGELPFK